MRRIIRRLLTRPLIRPTAARKSSFGLRMTNLEDRVTPATFTVLNTNDTGSGSLRQAVIDANGSAGADTIVFDTTAFASPQTINLATGQISIADAVTINGPAARVTV